jgi:hypothetical protein
VLARRLLVILLAVAAATVAGCGGSSGGNDDADDTTVTTARRTMPDACTLVSAKEASAFLGAPVERVPVSTPSSVETDVVASQCTYSTGTPLQVLTVATSNDVRVLAGSAYGDSVPTRVGEEAYLRTGDPPGTLTLQFRQRGAVVTLLYSDLRSADPTRAASPRGGPLVAVGERAAARL